MMMMMSVMMMRKLVIDNAVAADDVDVVDDINDGSKIITCPSEVISSKYNSWIGNIFPSTPITGAPSILPLTGIEKYREKRLLCSVADIKIIYMEYNVKLLFTNLHLEIP